MNSGGTWPWPRGYEVRRVLSEGEGGIVGLATHGTGRLVALKLLRLAPGVDAGAALLRHQRLQALTACPGLLPMMACGLTEDRGWLWEELAVASTLPGESPLEEGSEQEYQPATLRAELIEQGPFSVESTVALGLTLCHALATLHEAGLVHRDVKTGNLLRVNGEVVLGDYGLTAEPGAPFDFRGTEGYIPTEGTADPAADLFALGKTLYELWTGCDRLEFPTLPLAVLNSRDWRQRGQLLNEVLLKACSPRSRERFQSAVEFADALQKVARGRQPLLTHRRGVAIAAAIMLAVGGARVLRTLPAPSATAAPTPTNVTPPVAAPNPRPAGELHIGRRFHAAVRLQDGWVLVSGGEGERGHLASAEVYNPRTEKWSQTGPMSHARREHRLTLLPDGKVLVTGGVNETGQVASCELFDPARGAWLPTGPLHFARSSHSATLLPDGRVLVAGGHQDRAQTTTAEVYDAATGTWQFTGALQEARGDHTATLLPGGRVLVVGGYCGSLARRSAELYLPDRGVWAKVAEMSQPRYYHTANLLEDGTVLVAGGASQGNREAPVALAETYDPDADQWRPAGTLHRPRLLHASVRLSQDIVLVTGGPSGPEWYSPTTRTWLRRVPTSPARYMFTLTVLNTGDYLLAGGTGADGRFLLTSEVGQGVGGRSGRFR